MLYQLLVSALAVALPVVMPELTRSAGLFEGLAGLYSMMMYVGAMVATLAGEQLFRRFGAAFVIGLGYGPVSPASSHMMAGIVGRPDLNFIFSVRQAGAPLGVLVAGLLIPVRVNAIGWRWSLVVMAVTCVIIAAATLGFARRVAG